MEDTQYKCSKCGHVTSDILDPECDFCPECGEMPMFDDMKWMPAGGSPPVAPPRARYAEEIKGYFNCEDGADFLVVARKGQGFISSGAVYVFVQDRAAHVWRIAGFSSSGFFKKKLVLDLVGQGGDRRKITIDSIREPLPDQVAKCIAMAATMAQSGMPIFSTAFQWTPYDPEDGDRAWSMIR